MATQKSTQAAPAVSVIHSAIDRTSYTRKQLESVLETIANRARTLQLLLMYIQHGGDEHEISTRMDAAVLIATGIGSVADSAIGGTVYGNHDCWNHGPNFDGEGKGSRA